MFSAQPRKELVILSICFLFILVFCLIVCLFFLVKLNTLEKRLVLCRSLLVRLRMFRYPLCASHLTIWLIRINANPWRVMAPAGSSRCFTRIICPENLKSIRASRWRLELRAKLNQFKSLLINWSLYKHLGITFYYIEVREWEKIFAIFVVRTSRQRSSLSHANYPLGLVVSWLMVRWHIVHLKAAQIKV